MQMLWMTDGISTGERRRGRMASKCLPNENVNKDNETGMYTVVLVYWITWSMTSTGLYTWRFWMPRRLRVQGAHEESVEQ